MPTIAATSPATVPVQPNLAGVWLVDSAATFPPHFLINSKLTLTANGFALTGYFGIEKPWSGSFKLGAGGDSRNLDLQTDAFDLSQRGLSQAYPPSAVRGIYKFEPAPDGDRLTICFAIHDDVPRPTDFTSTENTRLATFVRAEPDFKSVPDHVIVTVLDPEGRPASGASIFDYMSRQYPSTTSDNGKTWRMDMKAPMQWSYAEVAKTAADGTATLPFKAFENAVAAPGGARDPSHNWMGFANVSPAALRHGTLTIRMQPQRKVRGTIGCDELTRLGKPPPLCYAYLLPYDNRIAWCFSEKGAFEFPVPPGEYRLYSYGNDLHGKDQMIVIPSGTDDFVLPPISLTPSKILTLVGEQAPALRGVLAWKNGAIDLSSLKGKVVLLDFWGYWCGNCVVEMPTLIRLHDKYKDKGLAIVSVHVDSEGEIGTVADLDERTKMYRDGIWKGRDVPFPTALVSGRSRADGRCLAADDYGVLHFPTTVAIGRDGKVLGHLNDQVDVDLTGDEKTVDSGIERLLDAK